MRMTENRRRILEALRPPATEDEWIERGAPPYCASQVAEVIGADYGNTSRALKIMATLGLVVPKRRWLDVWAEGLKGTQGRSALVKRRVTGYWAAATFEEDSATVAERAASHEERTSAILDKLTGTTG